ncbi:MAG: VCBS repeat-containing protein [Planctomycetes bacterium]|nr:VCBS repeat-containing protein [Planctomycetota bacterium]
MAPSRRIHSGTAAAAFGFAAFATAQGFQAPVSYTLGASPRSIHASDFNSDGYCDLFATTDLDGRMLLGQPGGGFAAGPTSTNPNPNGDTAIADFNGDGNLDLVRTSPGFIGNVLLQLGDGLGGFAPAITLGNAQGSSESEPHVADANGDGVPDVLVATVASATSLRVSCMLGVGGGGVQAPLTSLWGAVLGGARLQSMALADLNDDGAIDLVLEGGQLFFGGFLAPMQGAGDGTFSVSPGISFCTEAFGSIAVGDLNGDLREDFLFGGQTPPPPGSPFIPGVAPVGFIPSLATGVLGTYVPLQIFNAIGQFSYLGGLKIGDATADGKADAFYVEANTGTKTPTLWVAAASPGGQFLTPPVPTSFGASNAFAAGFEAADFDLDGRLDVAAGMSTGEIVVLRGAAPTATGVAMYGAGTPGCHGTLAVSTNSTPQVGNAAYGYFFTNGPANSLGLFLATDSQDLAGSDPFGLNITLHVDFFSAIEIYAADILFDASGQGFVASPIPPLSGFAGLQYYVQALGLERARDGWNCNASSFGLSASRGLSIVVAP